MSKDGLIELEAVMAIARRGSFRQAALELGMSTSALSSSIGKIERQLGVQLFNRTTRSVSLTDAGRRFVEQVGPALEDIQEAMRTARSQQATPSGTIRINAFATAAQEVFAPLILEYLRRYPHVHIDLVTEGKLVDVVDSGFDLGIRTAELVPTDMIAVPLGPARRFAVVATPDYLAKHGAPETPSDLLGHPCIRIRLPNGARYRWQFTQNGETLHVDVAGPVTLDEPHLARMAVLDGIGIGFFMESNVRDDIAAGRLVRLLEDWTPPGAPLALYYPGRRNQSAALKAFIALARAMSTNA
ncbi:DNA-binding transcriptional LysR family regulator [Sphingomonas trueperi]|uniref:LysR family transcriptional regulator n=1 Tax=Sphingomonas trueperi TaxID=53317 RepID=UPI003393542B